MVVIFSESLTSVFAVSESEAMAVRGQSVEDFFYFSLCLLLTVRLLLGKTARNEFVYWFKYSLYLSYSFFVVSFNCIFFVLRPFNLENFSLLRPYSIFISWCLGIKHEVRFKEDVKEEGAVVVINHQNTLDVLMLLNIWPTLKKCVLVAKRELFFIGPFGLGLWLSGVVPINRKSKESSYRTLRNIASLMQKENTKMVIFPEGTRNKQVNSTRTLLPFKKGAFHMAIFCQAPIIPVVVSPYLFVRGGPRRFFGQGTTTMEILPAIPTAGLTKQDVDALMQKTYSLMQNKFEELFEESERNRSC